MVKLYAHFYRCLSLYIYELFFLQLNFPTCEVFWINSYCNNYVFFEIT